MTVRTFDEVQKHSTKDSCWVVIEGKVYDLTKFLPDHPGGVKAILKKAGKDATKEFDLIHPPSVKKQLQDFYIGDVSGEPPKQGEKKKVAVSSTTVAEKQTPPFVLPALDAMFSLDDFEQTAKQLLSSQAWAYYWSGSDDMVTKNYNREVFKSVFLRPRIFKDVAKCDTSSSVAGVATTLPIFVCPAAMARLAHPDGEQGIAWACAQKGIVQMFSNNASMAFDETVLKDYQASNPAKTFFQLYVQDNRAVSEKMLELVLSTKRCSAIVLTLDAATPGKREADDRAKNEEVPEFDPSDPWPFDNPESDSGGIGKKLFAGTTASLVWSDLEWLYEKTDGLPIILKGVQTVEDVVIAAKHPQVTGVILSNHGGRAMDTCQPPLAILQEVRTYAPHVFDKLEIYVDGGIRRGTDVVKALCLGAKHVGIGRPALFALAGYGRYGVLRVLDILQEEIETCLRLLGATSIDQLGPHYLNTRQLENLVAKL